MSAPLNFVQLREANEKRCAESFGHTIEGWSLTDWMTAVAGEVGEAANIIKKIHRGDYGHADINDPEWYPASLGGLVKQMLADEFADVVCYLDMLANRAGIDLGEAVRKKFNEVSKKKGSKVKL